MIAWTELERSGLVGVELRYDKKMLLTLRSALIDFPAVLGEAG
jgi:hypothetical protein